MYEILKLIQDTPIDILEKNRHAYEKVEFLAFNHRGPGSIMLRHTDQPNADFHFEPGSDGAVLMPNQYGQHVDLLEVSLEL